MMILLTLLMYCFIFITQIVCIEFSSKYIILKMGESYFRGESKITIVLMSFFIFMLFKNLNFNEYKIIFTLGKTSFGVYLLHDNPYFRMFLWKNIFHVESFYNANVFVLLIHILSCVVIIFILGTIVDLIRAKLIENWIFRIKKLNLLFDKVDTKFNA